MGKRSFYKRRRRDHYRTPVEALHALQGHIVPQVRFAEPCAGNGQLIDHMRTLFGAHCGFAGDVLPMRGDVIQRDALTLTQDDLRGCDMIVTNPPWERRLLHSMIDHFRQLRPVWLLFDADWMHTKQAAQLMLCCHRIVSVGRVKWIAGSASVGKDNCCWYLFDRHGAIPRFYGRRL